MRLNLGGRPPGFQLRTQRLLLRDFRPGEALPWHADPRYLEHYAEAPDSDAIVAVCATWAREVPRRRFQLGVELDGRLIGCVGVRVEDEVGELGGEIDPDFWRRGLCSEALVGLMGFAREELGVTRFEAVTRNPGMVRLCQGLGLEVVSVDAGETRLAG